MNLLEGKVPVTVLIPCFNSASSIGRAVSSVAAQTGLPAELILIDDASSDTTWVTLQELEQTYPGWIKLLRFEQNQGVASARNAGWQSATQPYIAFLDADDVWHPGKLKLQLAYMQGYPEVDLCCHRHRVLLDSGAKPDWVLPPLAVTRISRRSLLTANRFITPSVMIRRDIRQRFAEGQRYMEDRLLWMEIVCDGGRIDRLEIELAATYKMPYGASGLSSNLLEMTLADMSNYRRLRVSHKLSWLMCQLLQLFALFKFARRLVKVAFWQVRANPMTGLANRERS